MRVVALLAAPAVAVLLLGGLTACDDHDPTASDVDPAQVDATEVPALGACRVLTPRDTAEPTNATRTVGCDRPHTAETFAVGTLPAGLASVGYDSSRLADFAYRTCGSRFEVFLGADESLVMRTIVTWAWFRPSAKAWDQGARWYRCDVVGGGAKGGSARSGTGSGSGAGAGAGAGAGSAYVDLPTTARGLLAGSPPPDRWMVCATGASVQSAPRIPCSRAHTWRAVTAIRVGDPGDDYPGDRQVESKTRAYCSDYVGAWLGYPESYDFGYTWFHAAEWRAGNRRSVCWAKTTA